MGPPISPDVSAEVKEMFLTLLSLVTRKLGEERAGKLDTCVCLQRRPSAKGTTSSTEAEPAPSLRLVSVRRRRWSLSPLFTCGRRDGLSFSLLYSMFSL